jgi:ATP-binding cassette subfamily B protein
MIEERNPQALKLAARHYWEQMRANWATLFPGFLFSALGNIFVFYIPTLIVARVLFNFGSSKAPDINQLVPYLLLFIATWGLGEVFWRISLYLVIKGETRGARQLYLNAMKFLLDKDLAFFHDNFAGSLTKRANGYGWRFIDVVDTMLFHIFSVYLGMVFAFVVLWRFSPWIVVALVGMLILTALCVFPLIKRRMRIVAKREASHNIMTGHIADTLGNIDTVKAFANEDQEQLTHEKYVSDWTKKAKRSWDYQNFRIDVMTSPFFVLTNTLGLILALLISHGNASTLEVVFVTFSYFTQTTRIVWEFSDVYRRLESSMTEVAQFTELLLNSPTVKDTDEPSTLKVTAGRIDMVNVDFKYSDSQGEHLFKNFNLSIESGEKVALVGHSGGGKTTVTRLLLRFMDVDGGQILLDGQDISKVRQSDLRKDLAYVPQEPAMFHRSLADNIAYGKPGVSLDEIKKVAKLAHAAEFIDDLPKGYETLVGERGVKLSGGQRQRIAIARAMIKDAPVLILDEATSALDSGSEKLIQAALWQLMEGRTAIVIAHRLSTIQRMDRIVVLDRGQIAEQGSHKELLAHKGIYATLWAHQSGGFLED